MSPVTGCWLCDWLNTSTVLPPLAAMAEIAEPMLPVPMMLT